MKNSVVELYSTVLVRVLKIGKRLAPMEDVATNVIDEPTQLCDPTNGLSERTSAFVQGL